MGLHKPYRARESVKKVIKRRRKGVRFTSSELANIRLLHMLAEEFGLVPTTVSSRYWPVDWKHPSGGVYRVRLANAPHSSIGLCSEWQPDHQVLSEINCQFGRSTLVREDREVVRQDIGILVQ